MLPTTTLQRILPADIDEEIARMPTAIWGTISHSGALYALRKGSERFFLVLWADKRVGMVGYAPTMDADKGVWLTFCGILPDYRGNGFFKSAMTQLEVLIQNEFPSAELMKEIGPEHVIDRFERIGFTLVKNGSKDWGNVLHRKIVRQNSPRPGGNDK
jgi:GNAT superfamily N-acetyltransferase